MPALNRTNAITYLQSKHLLAINVVNVDEFLEDATPVIRVTFVHDGEVEHASVWIERRDDQSTFIHGEW